MGERTQGYAGALSCRVHRGAALADGPANKQKGIELMMKESKIPADVAGETYAVLIEGHGGYADDARFDLDGFKNVLKLRAEVEGQWGGHPPAPEKYYDSSYYVEALAKLKGAK